MDLPSVPANLFTSTGSTSPFTVGGQDPLTMGGIFNTVTAPITAVNKAISDVTGIPQGLSGLTSTSGSIGDKITAFLGDDTGAFFTRFGLEIVGGIFLVFGFLMLALRSTDSGPGREIAATVAAVAK